MDIIFVKAIILGIIQGVTEFLPISSTGHIIIAGDFLDFHSKGKVFEITVLLGAISAVIFEYRNRFTFIAKNFMKDKETTNLVLNLLIAFIPVSILGVLFHNYIKNYLFNSVTVSIALIVGGFVILIVEKRNQSHAIKIQTLEQIKPKNALMIGLAQCFALIPGTSRSGSTIMGGMFVGIDRKVATEFSFFLAVPVIVSATFYDIYKNYQSFNLQDVALIITGFIATFIAALIAVRALLKYLSTNTFIPFAWYRIIFGSLILILWSMGYVK